MQARRRGVREHHQVVVGSSGAFQVNLVERLLLPALPPFLLDRAKIVAGPPRRTRGRVVTRATIWMSRPGGWCCCSARLRHVKCLLWHIENTAHRLRGEGANKMRPRPTRAKDAHSRAFAIPPCFAS